VRGDAVLLYALGTEMISGRFVSKFFVRIRLPLMSPRKAFSFFCFGREKLAHMFMLLRRMYDRDADRGFIFLPLPGSFICRDE
jgi:hypothetical protein